MFQGLKNFFRRVPATPFDAFLRPDQCLRAEHERLVYSYDASNLKGMPSLVLLPETLEELSACLAAASSQGIKMVARGAGTNLAGASVAPEGEVVLSLTRLNQVEALDPEARLALVQCGVVNLDLQKKAAQHGLFFAPDPASQKASTLGGNISQNSGGPHCLKYGITTHHVLAVELAGPDGKRTWFGNPQGEAPGPDLRGLLVGAEGCLGVVTRAWLRLLPVPAAVQTALLCFPDVKEAVDAVSAIIAAGLVPATLELMDRFILEAVEQFQAAGYPQGAGAILVAEVDGRPEELDGQMGKITALARQHGCFDVRVAHDEAARTRLWEGRRGAHAAVARLRPSVWVEDGTVPRNRLAEALARLREIARREDLQVGYLFHAGDGNFHPLILFDDRNQDEWNKVRAAGGEMLKACVDLGGTITGEHGVGLDKLPFMEYQFDPAALEVMAELKLVFDPGNSFNPGKMIPPAYVEAAKASRPPSPLPAPSVHGRGDSREIFDYDPANLTLEAGAGLEVEEAASLAARDGLRLGFGASFQGATLGDCVSRNDSGPWSQRLRDSLLGLEAVLPDGRKLKVGRKVVKNVAGFDLTKLFVGSGDAYGRIDRVIFKLQPGPESETLFLFEGPGFSTAPLAAFRQAGLEPAAFTCLSQGLAAVLAETLGLRSREPQDLWLADLAGLKETESGRREDVRRLMGPAGLKERFCLEGENRREVWDFVCRLGDDGKSLWRSWPGSSLPDALREALEGTGTDFLWHQATGELRLVLSGPCPSAVLDQLENGRLRISVLKGSRPPRCWWGSEPDVRMAKKLKDHFDPGGVFPPLEGS
jgi:glycolate oxidase subunit GlcD